MTSYVKSCREGGKTIKAVVANAEEPDNEGIVNLCASGLVLDSGEIST